MKSNGSFSSEKAVPLCVTCLPQAGNLFVLLRCGGSRMTKSIFTSIGFGSVLLVLLFKAAQFHKPSNFAIAFVYKRSILNLIKPAAPSGFSPRATGESRI